MVNTGVGGQFESSDELTRRIQDALPLLSEHLVQELSRIVQRLVDAMEPEQIYVFGSQARGDATADSDVDLVVVVRSSDEPGHRRDQAALRAIGLHRLPLDVLVLTREELSQFADSPTSLQATIRREGRTLYAAA
jgi:uncharacterized protein